jgi:arsenite-transporting ATPase
LKRTKKTDRPPRLLFFGGKGGVGKTTCAAAYAIDAASSGLRTLAVSTDPAHSLGDALGVRLPAGGRSIPLGRRRSLRALELDGPRAFERWLEKNRAALTDIIEHGTWLTRGDIDALLELPLPGVDELIGLLEIVRLSESAYDLVVVDTAPTGHTLRLLAAPATVGVVASALGDLQQEHRIIREQLARIWQPEAADRFIEQLGADADHAAQMLRQSSRVAFHWVMLPEELSLAETGDALRMLRSARVPVSEIILNRVWPDGPRCAICDPRRREERRVIARIERTLGGAPIRFVDAEPREPRGVAALRNLGKIRKTAGGRASQARHWGGPESAALELRPFRDARLIWVGGKGGVGKSTVASAIALRLARVEPRRRVLLLSTDPAPSLVDVLGTNVAIRNLEIREVDAAAEFKKQRAAFERAFDEITLTIGAGTIAAGESLNGLLDLAPPGIDELFGLVSVAALIPTSPKGPVGHGQQDVVVVDSAPTGHALRLLEMPDAALEWVQLFMRLLLKYRDLVRPGQLAAELVALSQSIRRLRALLQDRHAAHFIVVTRAADVPRRETERLLDALRALRVGVRALVVNAMTLEAECPMCRSVARAERSEFAAVSRAVRRHWRECAIIQTPLVARPPRGVPALERWSRTWIAEPTSTA